MSTLSALSTRHLIARIAAALLGSYGFTWGFCALGITLLTALGVSFHTAETSVMLLAFLVYLGLFLWSFAESSLVRIWSVLACGTAIMTGAAWALQRVLLG
jgi:hypothetical protein